MRVAALLGLACTALRLLPSLLSLADRRAHPSATAAVISAAQLLNAAACPYVMSACTCLSEEYFPPNRCARPGAPNAPNPPNGPRWGTFALMLSCVSMPPSMG
jgi:hypothetical protein